MRKMKITAAFFMILALGACGTPEQVASQPRQPADSTVVAVQTGVNNVVILEEDLSVSYPTVTSLKTAAELRVRGRVVATRTLEAHNTVQTQYTLDIESIYRGESTAKTITVVVPGGETTQAYLKTISGRITSEDHQWTHHGNH